MMVSDRVLPTSQSTDLPTFTIFSEGRELPGTVNIISIAVNKTINRIPTARITFKDGDAAKEDFPLSNGDALLPGKEIEITAGYHNDNETIFQGVVVKHSIRVGSNRNTYLTIECKDKTYRMSVGRKNRYFTNTKDSEAIAEIIQPYNLANQVELTDSQHRELVQYNTSDWDFIVARAEINGKLVIVDDGQIAIAKPDFSAESVVRLIYGATIESIEATLDATHQHTNVNCVAWNPANQEVVESEAAALSITEAGNLTAAALAGVVSDDTRRYQHPGNLPTEELQNWATAQKLKNVLGKIRGVVKCKGLPQVKPGKIIELAGVGDRFNGKVLVSGVRHELSDGNWEMNVQFGLSPDLFVSEHDVTDLPAGGLLPAVNGLQIGVVSQLQNDPDGEDRVLVKMPVVDDDAEGTWARVASLDAGDNRGAFFRPEIGDEVVLGFLDDDPRKAVILGMLNSSKKPAPVTATDENHEKGFYTRDKLKLVFNDELKSIRLETPKGYVLQLSEDAGSILIQDEHNNKIEMKSDGIFIESAKDIQMKATGNIKIEGVNVQVSANSTLQATGNTGAELSASGTTVIKGYPVMIN
jgi:Rhs element Vgr protein